MAEDRTSKCVLPASPNWYCSSGSDYGASGVYAFAAKKCVYLLDVREAVPVFKGQFSEHTDRVSSVKFCPHGLYSNLCVSGADDKSVRLWDVETAAVVASHTAHKAKVTCVSWSPIATDLILSADEKGMVIAWRHDKNTVYSTCPVQEYIFCLSASCLSDQQAAVGYKNGLIIILQLDEQGIRPLHRLRGHDSDVQSMTWCPVPLSQLDLGPIQMKATDAQGHLLLSGSRDQTIRLWDTLSGKLISVWNLPKRPSQKWRDKQHDWQSKERLWLAVCWPSHRPNTIVTSSHGGDLLLWDLGASNVKDQVQAFGQGHSRIVFNISSSTCGTRLLTTSMDRQIILWDSSRCRNMCTIPTLGGFVYAMAISPLDPGTVALGVGDNMIRVWQTTSAISPYDALTLWQGIKSKVMMVRWHPHKEGLLAFGTDDGQVGIYNILSKSKPEVFASYHKKTVYSLSWGPPCPAVDGVDKSTYHLYSCGGDGSVLGHRPGHPMTDAVDINSLIKSTNDIKRKLVSRTDVSWNCDGTAMALGNDDGTIEVFIPPSLHQVCIITAHKKGITCLAWHHGYGDTESGEESAKFLLASGSNESTIHVHDLGKVLGGTLEPSADVTSITSSYRQLIGHSGRVTALSWSPHHVDRLASSCYDGSAQIWDVERSQPLANFRGHVGRVMSVCWSYLDPDVVYSGGEDGTARPWRISEQTHPQPPVVERFTARSKSSKNKKKSKSKDKDKPEDEKPQTSQNDGFELPLSEPSIALDTSAITELTSRQVADAEAAAPERQLDNGPTNAGTSVLTATFVPQTKSDSTRNSLDSNWRTRLGPEHRGPEQDWRSRPQELEVGTVVKAESPNQALGLEGVSSSATDFNWRARPTPQESDVASGASVDDDDASSVGTLSTRDSAPFHYATKTKSDGGKKKKKVKSMFPLSAVADNKSKATAQQECVTLARYMNAKDLSLESEAPLLPGEADIVNLGFFADRRSAYKMLVTEGQHHAETSNIDYQLQLEVWKGNLAGALEMAAKERQLSDWLVALSPLAGHDVWLNTAEMFADQLATQGAHQRAVLYYLACHKVYCAIDVYKKHAMFREAIALAKVRLSPSDPVLHDLYVSWARKLETENAYEQAAKCYLAVHLPADAVRILSTRGDQSSLSTALQVAVISGEHQLASSIAVRVLHLCLGTGNWSGAHSALDGCRGVEGHVLALCTHELLVQELTGQGTLSGLVFADHCPSMMSEKNSNWKLESVGERMREIEDSSKTNDTWIVLRILHSWDRLNLLTMDHSVQQSALKQLMSYNESNLDENLTIKQVLVRASYDIACAVLCGIRQDPASCTMGLLQAMATCMKNNYFELLESLCVLLLPEGKASLCNIVMIGEELNSVNGNATPLRQTPQASYRELFDHINAYYLMVLLYKIWWREPGVMAMFEKGKSQDVKKAPSSESDDDKMSKSQDSSDSHVPDEGETSESRAEEGSKGNEDSEETLHGCGGINSNIEMHFTDMVDSINMDDSHSQCKVYNGSDNMSQSLLQDSPISKTPIAPSTLALWNSSWGNIHEMLVTIRKELLSDNIAQRRALKTQLAEVKKAIVLLRSRRILESVAMEKGAVKRKKTKSKPVEPVDGSNGSVSAGSEAVLLEVESTSDVTSNGLTAETYPTPKERLDVQCDRKDKEGVDSVQSFCGDLSLDARYQVEKWSLESIEQEERRLLQELDKHTYKDLPFPDPVETSMVLGYLCCHQGGLSIDEPALLYQLGLEVSRWGLEYAQWNREKKCLKRLMDRCSKQ